jgi:hypothetical protein
MRSRITAAVVCAFVFAAAQASAGQLQFGGQWSPEGGRKLDNGSIGQSRLEADYLGGIGPVLAGGNLEGTRNGHTGKTFIRTTLRVGHAWSFGRLTITPYGLLGYQFATRDDCLLVGGEALAAVRLAARISFEATGRYRECAATNAPEHEYGRYGWRSFEEPSVRGGPVFWLGDRTALGWNIEQDWGTNPATRIGGFVRVRF